MERQSKDRENTNPIFIPVIKKPNGEDRNESTDLMHDQPLNLAGWPLPYTGKKAMHGEHGGHGQFVLWLTNKWQNKSMLLDVKWKQPNSTTTSIGLGVPGAWDRYIESSAGAGQAGDISYSFQKHQEMLARMRWLARVQALFTMSPPFLNIEEDQLVHAQISQFCLPLFL
jgi:hypothetical protein